MEKNNGYQMLFEKSIIIEYSLNLNLPRGLLKMKNKQLNYFFAEF